MSATEPSIRFREANDFLRPGGDWDALRSESDADTVFLSAAWLRAAKDAFVRDEQTLLPTVEFEGATVAAGAFVARGGTIEFLGTGPCDYLDVLVDRRISEEHARRCVRELLRAASGGVPRFRCFVLRNVPAASPTIARLERSGFFTTILRTAPAPAMDMIAADEALKKKSVRRHFNKLSKAGELTCWTTSVADETLPKLDAFFDLHVRRWADTAWPSLFNDPVHRDFFHKLTRELSDAGTLRYTEIRLDDRLMAAHWGATSGGVFTWYKPAYDPQSAHLSPGEVLLKTLIEQARSENAKEFDFTIGDEAFKHRFATVTRQVVDLHVGRSRLRSSLLFGKLAAKASIRAALDRAGLWERLKRMRR